MSSEIIMYVSKCGNTNRVNNYAVVKNEKGELELKRCKKNNIISEFHRSLGGGRDAKVKQNHNARYRREKLRKGKKKR